MNEGNTPARENRRVDGKVKLPMMIDGSFADVACGADAPLCAPSASRFGRRSVRVFCADDLLTASTWNLPCGCGVDGCMGGCRSRMLGGVVLVVVVIGR